jgi:dTDP-4-dehydrorhamnose 3,5-epimerase
MFDIPTVIEPKVFKDDRGYFMESWKKDSDLYPNTEWVQENESCSSKGVMRGYHWQKTPYAQAKLVRVVSGRVIDYAIDMRKDSPNFGKRYEVELSGENKKQFFIPRGFAHAFIALEDNTIFQYKCDNKYSKESEGALNVNDYPIPDLGIEILQSEKDRNAKHFNGLTDEDLKF